MIKRIAVIGPGLMGLGIAQLAAAKGLQVVLVGRDGAAAKAGLGRLAMAMQRQVEKGRVTAVDAQLLLSLIEPSGDDSLMAGCELGIEAVAEDRANKTAVLLRLQAALPEEALIATNTSGLPVSGLAKALQRPGRFMGMHFFSPVERMRLVELVRGESTAAATMATGSALVRQLGHSPIVVRDGPGFFTSRVFAAYLDEALAMVGEGVAPALIDQAGVELGRAIGPLAVLDEVSLRLNLQQARQARADGLAERYCRPLAEPVLARMVAVGRGGRRDGGGFYDHDGGIGRRLWPGLGATFAPLAAQPGLHSLQLRLRCIEVLEALRCLEEGVLASADDADMGSLLGLGFPASSGGILRWVEARGLNAFCADCHTLAQEVGPRFAPSAWLLDLAERGQGVAAWRVPG